MTRYTIGLGYPAQIAFLKQRYGFGTQTHLELRRILESWYSSLRAYLPDVMGDEYDEKVKDKMFEAALYVEALNESYDSSFEGLLTCNPDEKKYCALLFHTYTCLDEITAISHILDKTGMGNESMVA